MATKTRAWLRDHQVSAPFHVGDVTIPATPKEARALDRRNLGEDDESDYDDEEDEDDDGGDCPGGGGGAAAGANERRGDGADVDRSDWAFPRHIDETEALESG